ncbi:MAG: serine--tRNA ligase [Rhodospirillaceae bacterium]|jgi:seryl-tRNA synthetase|nr:serine--tRNA ligase [Rhodospirillaceae bacterium]MBT5243298.1 serine--tRNA ligase [Rhodospirillaceae bacterium]MBT5563918.1 serine--tRNA ligase [Rhodospirillaceae bacterium]MBT6240878.1 serine--tRNA ligase [Rhodospirillaceae bacterium]MBT7137345.1 serine--tRNA ligase [Rhodospirillaceae bacterium]
MFDIKWIRENPDAFDKGLARRKLDPQSSALIALDKQRREAETQAQELQASRNKLSKEIGNAKAKGEDATDIIAEVSRSKEAQGEAEEQARVMTDHLTEALSVIPNLPMDSVPDGDNENDNREERTWGDIPGFDFSPKEHFDLGEALGLMDFDTAAKMSGARFVLLTGALARMERALAAFMLDLHTNEHDLTEVNPPALVRDTALYNTGQLPKFGEDLFKTEDGLWMIPTAEVPLTNIVADEIVDEATLPRRYAAMTWCFRSEAGSSGKDTRGMIRQHQFTKVEMVSIVKPENSEDELERMTGCAEEVLKRLGLPYRVVTLCTGDLGFGARRTFDIEVWLPGQDRYREISSCSNCGDFQARRMKARFRTEGEKGTQFVHTLNGSGLAVGRTLVAVLENYQREDGSIVVPEALRPYMGGLEVISADA